LAETGLGLGASLKDILDLTKQPRAAVARPGSRQPHRLSTTSAGDGTVARVMATLDDELRGSDWYTDTWLDDALNRHCNASTRRATAARALRSQWLSVNAERIIGRRLA